MINANQSHAGGTCHQKNRDEFARSLRPSVLGDIGLAPVLNADTQDLQTKTGLVIRLRSYPGIKHLDINHRTVLYRVTQEALTTVARNAHAATVGSGITKTTDTVHVIIPDDGRSFKPQRVLSTSGPHSLGLIGTRERLEMVDGTFHVDSHLGKGTTITAAISLAPHGDRPVDTTKEAA